MKKIMCLFLITIFFSSFAFAQDASSEGWTPVWQVGDWWEIEVFYGGRGYNSSFFSVANPKWSLPKKIHYEVIGEQTIEIDKHHLLDQEGKFTTTKEGILCFVVEITFLNSDNIQKTKVFYSEDKLVIYRTEDFDGKNFYRQDHNLNNPLPIFSSSLSFPFTIPLFPLNIQSSIGSVKIKEIGLRDNHPGDRLCEYQTILLSQSQASTIIENSIIEKLQIKNSQLKEGAYVKLRSKIITTTSAFIASSEKIIEANFKRDIEEYQQIWGIGKPWAIYGRRNSEAWEDRYYLSAYGSK